jgi:DHA1 family bicyclomycin/chloramphenicol resistance-like MFS transporter
MLVTLFETTEFVMLVSLIINPFASALVGLLFGRYSDVLGRRRVMLVALALLMLGSLICSFAVNIETFFIGRLFQAIGGGGVSVLVIAILSDLFTGIKFARVMGILSPIFPITWAVAPLIGAQLLDQFSWQAPFMAIFVASFSVASILFFYLPETLDSTLTKLVSGTELLAKIMGIFRHRDFLPMALGHALPICVYIAFTSNSSFIFINTFGFSPVGYSVIQAIPVLINLVGTAFYQKALGRLGIMGSLKFGLIGYAFYTCLSLGVLVHLIPHNPYALITVMCCHALITPFIISLCAIKAFEVEPQDRGLSVALVALVRNMSVSVVAVAIGFFFNGTIVPLFIGSTLIAAATIVIVNYGLRRQVSLETTA